MNLQKINWKIFFKDASWARPDIFFKVFNNWIPNSPEIFIDVADYQHVHDGPLTLLVGHYVDYSLDASDSRLGTPSLGLVYNCKKPMEGDNRSKLVSTLRSLLSAGKRLEADPVFEGKLSFDAKELDFIVNDRALAPYHDRAYKELKGDLDWFFSQLYGEGQYTLEPETNPKKRFAVEITSIKSLTLNELLGKLPR